MKLLISNASLGLLFSSEKTVAAEQFCMKLLFSSASHSCFSGTLHEAAVQQRKPWIAAVQQWFVAVQQLCHCYSAADSALLLNKLTCWSAGMWDATTRLLTSNLGLCWAAALIEKLSCWTAKPQTHYWINLFKSWKSWSCLAAANLLGCEWNPSLGSSVMVEPGMLRPADEQLWPEALSCLTAGSVPGCSELNGKV